MHFQCPGNSGQSNNSNNDIYKWLNAAVAQHTRSFYFCLCCFFLRLIHQTRPALQPRRRRRRRRCRARWNCPVPLLTYQSCRTSRANYVGSPRINRRWSSSYEHTCMSSSSLFWSATALCVKKLWKILNKNRNCLYFSEYFFFSYGLIHVLK